MLNVLFHVGDDRYVIGCEWVKELVPRVNLAPAREAPPYVAGYLNYNGKTIAVLDLCRLLAGREAEERMHTRILLLEPEGGELFGLIAERVVGMVEESEEGFKMPPFSSGQPAYFGPVATDEEGIIRKIDVGSLYRVLDGEVDQKA